MSIDIHRTFHSPINNSPSKQLYSFSKSARFQPTRASPCKTNFYETKRGAFQKRAASFGFGKKMQFANLEGVPSAGTYNKQSMFENNKAKRKGFSFGKDENRSLIQNPEQVRKVPGPGAYISLDQKYKSSYLGFYNGASYSMRGKYEDPLTKDGNKLGPGHYPDHGNINERGFYFNTKFPSSLYCKIGKQERFERIKGESPGPGYYYGEEKGNLNGTGVYFYSKLATTRANSFGRSERPSPAKKNQAPDPGSYSSFSDFALREKDWRFTARTK